MSIEGYLVLLKLHNIEIYGAGRVIPFRLFSWRESEKWLFSGDTLFCGSIGRTDLPTGSGEQIMQSVEMLAQRFSGDVKVYPGHGDTTTMAEEIAHNPFLA